MGGNVGGDRTRDCISVSLRVLEQLLGGLLERGEMRVVVIKFGISGL